MFLQYKINFIKKLKKFLKKCDKMLAFFFLMSYNKQAVNERATKLNATVAQSVEQLIRNQQVAGSSPASSSKMHVQYNCKCPKPQEIPGVFACKKTILDIIFYS